jgi:hypothetical protein
MGTPGMNEAVRATYQAMLDEVFPTAEEKATYAAFMTALKHARDKMLGHADAVAFRLNIKEGRVASSNAHFNALADVDLEYWTAVLPKIRDALRKQLFALENSQ